MQIACFLLMGFGFYSLHGCLQVFASELSAEVRATAMALHSFFFFMGQTLGPIAVGAITDAMGSLYDALNLSAAMLAAGAILAAFQPRLRP